MKKKWAHYDGLLLEMTESDEQQIQESLASFVGGMIASYTGAKLLQKGDEYFSQSGLIMNDKVKRVEVDPWRNRHEYEGKIVMKGSVPWVAITKGRIGVGTIVRWTPVWTPVK